MCLKYQGLFKAFNSSSRYKQLSPGEFADLVPKEFSLVDGEDHEHLLHPRLSYVSSNIKGYYYMFVCESCGRRCRKAYSATINYPDNKVKKLCCGKCFGVKYKRKTKHEKDILYLATHPELLINYNLENLPVKTCLKITEAHFLLSEIEERVCMMANALK